MRLPKMFVAAAVLFGGLALPAFEAEAMPVQPLSPIAAPAPGVRSVYYRYYGYPGYRWRRPFFRRPYVYGWRRPFIGRGYGYRRYGYGGARRLVGSRAR